MVGLSVDAEIVRRLDPAGLDRFRTLRRACRDVARMLERSSEEQAEHAKRVWIEEALSWGRSALSARLRLELDDVSALLRARLERANRSLVEGDLGGAREILSVEVPSAERILGHIDMDEFLFRAGETVVFSFCPDEDLGRVRRLLLPADLVSSLRCRRLQFGIHWLTEWPKLEEADHEIPCDAFATLVFDEPALEDRMIAVDLRNVTGSALLVRPVLALESP